MKYGREQTEKKVGAEAPYKHTKYVDKHTGFNKVFPSEENLSPELLESNPQGENIEKTVTFEKRITVQTRLPKPWTTINLKNYSTRERKAILFMKFLWDHGYRKEIHMSTMEVYVERFLGGFRTTKQAYLGRVRIVGSRGNKRAIRDKGLFEKRRWIYFNPHRRTWILNHSIVPLPYHYRESLVPPLTPPPDNFRERVIEQANIEKISLTHSPREGGLGETVLEVSPNSVGIGKKNNNNNNCERENFCVLKNHAESESNPKLSNSETAILKAKPCEEKDRAKIEWGRG